MIFNITIGNAMMKATCISRTCMFIILITSTGTTNITLTITNRTTKIIATTANVISIAS